MPEATDYIKEFAGQTLFNVLFLIAGSILVANNRTVERRARHAFLFTLLSLACIASADWFVTLINGSYPHLRWIHVVLMALTFSLAPFLPVIIADTVFPGTRRRWIHGILIAQVALEVATAFGGFVFSVDASNTYHRGPLYILYMATYTFSALYLSAKSIRAGQTYQSANMTSIIAILASMMIGVGVQIIDPKIRMTWPAVSAAVILYFMFYIDMVMRTDALTKLLNRRSYDDFLSNPPLPCMILVIDIDSFKSVNDTYGHAYGDECIATLAHLIRRSFGNTGLCYRTGGDEFTVVLAKRIQHIDDAVEELYRLIAKAQGDDPRLPSVSVGHAYAESGCPDLIAVVNQADSSMYENKRIRKSSPEPTRI